MKISIIIPVYNEEETIEKLVKLLVNELSDISLEKEIIIINDGSKDNTGQKIRELKNRYNFLYIKNKTNLGKGAAVRKAINKVSGDYILIQDGDLEYNPKEIKKLVKVLMENSSKKKGVAVFGKRENLFNGRHFIYYLGGLVLTIIISILSGTKIKDSYTGYKIIPANFIKKINLKSNGFEFEAELTMKLIKNNIKIIEVPINYQPRSSKEGKKIRFKDFIKGFFAIIKYSFKN